MRRRQLLGDVGALGAAGLAGLAGCLGSGPGAGTDGPDDSPAGSPTTSPSPSPSTGSTLTDANFEVISVDTASPEQSAAVDWGDVVTVTGTTTGNNGCYVAELSAVDYAPPKLTVTVKAVEKEDADACTQALVTVDYEATFTFDGSLPDTVVVRHDSMSETTTVTTAHGPG